MSIPRWAFSLAAATLLAACGDSNTAQLSAAQKQRFASEGIVREADNLNFRYTRDPSGRGERWENRRASIIVTKSSLLIHKNEKIGLEITPRTQRDVAVERSRERVKIRSGRGHSEEVWSFEPSSDALGWTDDIRALIKASKGGSAR